MPTEPLVDIIKRELPALLRQNPEVRRYVLDLTRELYADRIQTEDRFERVLEELQREREIQSRKWEDAKKEFAQFHEALRRERETQSLKWEDAKKEFAQFHEALQREREIQALKWEDAKKEFAQFHEALRRERETQSLKWEDAKKEFAQIHEALRRERETQALKWEDARQEFAQVHEEIMAQAKKFDRSIGALGARWGLQSEAAFRNALAGILEESFGVTVRNVCEFDDEGEVFGRPDQVELDIIVKNGLLLILELKSSIDKAGMYAFERKVRFYEKRHQRQADRRIVISPMIEPKALPVARALGIETYSDSVDVPEA